MADPWKEYYRLMDKADWYTSSAHSLRRLSDPPHQVAANHRQADRLDAASRTLRVQAEQILQVARSGSRRS